MNQRTAPGLFAVAILSGCALVPFGNDDKREPRVYLLETAADVQAAEAQGTCTIVVTAPVAAPGYGGPGMRYTRSSRQIERFAFSRWAESPARMLEPLLLRALRASGDFAAVLPAPAAIVTDLRVESDEVRLVQVFSGNASEVQLSMSSRVYAPAERGLVGNREFRYVVPTAEAGPAAGVEAADQAVAMLLTDFVAFTRDALQSLETGCGQPP